MPLPKVKNSLAILIAIPLVGLIPQASRADDPKSGTGQGTVVSEMSKSIWSVMQDKNNHHWFGSNGQGVYRYDGKTITNFTTSDGLFDNKARGIAQDKAGNIYIAFGQGICKFDGQTWTKLPYPKDLSPMSEWKLQPDDLWFSGGQNSGRVYRYDGTTVHALAFPTTERGDEHYRRIPRDKFPNAKYSPYDVYTIYRDRRGHMWFGTADLGAVRFDGKNFDWLYENHLTNVPGAGSFGIRSIIEDKDGKFWICNTKHRYKVEANNVGGKKGEVSYQREPGTGNPNVKAGAGDLYFPSGMIDRDGNLWIASDGGGWRYDGKNMSLYAINTGGISTFLLSIYEDNVGDIWICTDSAGVCKFNGKTFERYKP